jgi:hypothetical protein
MMRLYVQGDLNVLIRVALFKMAKFIRFILVPLELYDLHVYPVLGVLKRPAVSYPRDIGLKLVLV